MASGWTLPAIGLHLQLSPVPNPLPCDDPSAFGLQDDGIVAKLLVPAGTKDIPVGTLMAILVDEEEHVAAFKDYQAGQAGGDSKPEADSKASSGLTFSNRHLILLIIRLAMLVRTKTA